MEILILENTVFILRLGPAEGLSQYKDIVLLV